LTEPRHHSPPTAMRSPEEEKGERMPALRTLGSLAFCAFLDAADFAMLPG